MVLGCKTHCRFYSGALCKVNFVCVFFSFIFIVDPIYVLDDWLESGSKRRKKFETTTSYNVILHCNIKFDR